MQYNTDLSMYNFVTLSNWTLFAPSFRFVFVNKLNSLSLKCQGKNIMHLNLINLSAIGFSLKMSVQIRFQWVCFKGCCDIPPSFNRFFFFSKYKLDSFNFLFHAYEKYPRMIIRCNFIVISIKKIVLNDFISEYLHRVNILTWYVTI